MLVRDLILSKESSFKIGKLVLGGPTCVNVFLFNPLATELFCQKIDWLEIVSFLCTFLQHAVR